MSYLVRVHVDHNRPSYLFFVSATPLDQFRYGDAVFAAFLICVNSYRAIFFTETSYRVARSGTARISFAASHYVASSVAWPRCARHQVEQRATDCPLG